MDDSLGLRCPKCLDVTMDVELHEDVEIDRCPTCQGIFLDKGELEEILTLDLGHEMDASRASLLTDLQDDLSARCPLCRITMEPVEFHGTRVDICRSCGGAFFDEGEIARIQQGA